MTETIESFEITVAERPVEPTKPSVYFLPLLLGVAGAVVAGYLFGETGWLWGLAMGVVMSAALRVARVPIDAIDVGLITAGSAVGVAVFNALVDARNGQIVLAESLKASPGWLLVGATVGFVLWRRTDDLHWPAIGAVALAFAVAGIFSMQWGQDIGYLRELRTSEIEAGVLQEIGRDFYTWTAFFTAIFGLSAVFSFRLKSAVLVAIGGAIGFSVFTFNAVGFSFRDIFTQVTALGEIESQFNFWPPEWTWAPVVGAEPRLAILEPMIETLQIAVVGATVGTTLALPLSFLASRPTAPSLRAYWISKAFLNVFRTIPDLFWATIFAIALGFGPFPGALAMIAFSLAIMAKLLSETVDAIDEGPLEAARATGSTHIQVIRHAALPQVLPNYVAYALYIFELNVRASVVLGFVGAGGIGRLLNEQRNFFQWDRVLAIVIVIFVAVLIIEAISITARRRLV